MIEDCKCILFKVILWYEVNDLNMKTIHMQYDNVYVLKKKYNLFF